MELMKIPISAYPAYTWLWNTAITAEGIKKRIDEMYECGIRAFYVIGEPNNFRPTLRRTFLSPEYLSDKYVELLYYAYSYAEKKGMHTWLYNEGGFPSGMVCGKIRKDHPELAKKTLKITSVQLEKDEPYVPSPQALAAFVGEKRIREGDSFSEETTVTEYRHGDDNGNTIQTDNASFRNTELFLEYTHERLKKRFGDSMGSRITLMFDDEAYMGEWTDGLEKLFYERYGYDIADYLPYVKEVIEPKTIAQYRAKSDYCMLCGDLVRNNYFIPMRTWLRKNGMYSTGHLDKDHRSDNCISNRYGNTMHTLRAFDVPGVDVIWSQIDYPTNGKNVEDGMEFFPRMASSAARQLGHSRCMSESLAVYGAHVTPDLMRYTVNYQAVRGISLFNFMVMSYGKENALPLQYRPSYIPENPSMNRLSEINEYTARLSHLLQESRAVIDTALYYPARSICAGGKLGKVASDSFDMLGSYLEKQGVSFDIIDEELVKTATIVDGALVSEFVTYRNVIVPKCDLEQKDILDMLSGLHGIPTPCVERTHPCIQARRVAFDNGNEGYFICNTGSETVIDTVSITTERCICKIDLFTGELCDLEYTQNGTHSHIPLKLLRGEGLFLLLTDKKQNTKKLPITETVCTLTDWSSFVSRAYEIDGSSGIKNTYYTDGDRKAGLYEWDHGFSGEVTYTCHLPTLDKGDYILSLGNVRHTATAYINGNKIGETTMPPYRIPFIYCGEGELTVTVANTAANACSNADYFEKTDIRDVGPYHAKMTLKEQKEPGGGLLGPVTVEKILTTHD